MFDRIARRYDLLNRLLSGGMDCWWRRCAVARIGTERGLLLDVATGTGDMIAAAQSRSPGLAAIGVDLASEMLLRARRKTGPVQDVVLVRGDAAQLPLPDRSVEAVTVAFGIRNMHDVPAALAEMRRVLVPGGRLVVLEFSIPPWPVRPLYLWYLRHLLPWIGGIVSGDDTAYRYLNRSIETFPPADAVVALINEAGLVSANATPLTCGIVTLYQGEAPR